MGIPSQIDDFKNYKSLVVRAVSVDPNAITDSAQKPIDSKGFASDVVMINIDQALNQNSSTTMKNVKVQNLSVPINIEIPITQAKPHDNYECAYYDEEKKEWILLPGGRYDSVRKVM